MPLPWYILANLEKTKKHAGVLANQVSTILCELAEEDNKFDAVDYYNAIAEFAAPLGVSLKYSEKGIYLTEPDAEVGLLKAQCHKWWCVKLKRIRARYLEHLEIATGEVGRDVFSAYDKKNKERVKKRKGINAYCSKQALSEYKYNKEKGKRYLESLELVNECGDVISLMKAVEAGVANPENMRNELMLRIRETEEMAEAMGYVGGFFNITTPSRFHAHSKSWDGSTPKEANDYLNKLFSQARAKLDRLEIPYLGLRVAEPHADGCPHWHMLLWMPERHYNKVNHTLRRYFTRDDRGVFFERFKRRRDLRAKYTKSRRIWGLNKKRGVYTKEPKKDYTPSGPRYTAIKMDPATVEADGKRKGGAAAYIAKYISKNIDGFALANEYDAETGEKLTQAINPVKAWASTWGIRQFQFQKSPPITIWRELRRVREEIKGNDDLEKIRLAADQGDFKTFVDLMGGFGIGRDARYKPAYEITPHGNEYGECVKRLKGIEDTQSFTSLVTRVHTWDKQPIGTATNNNTNADTLHDANNVGAADLSWTSGNNCTPCTTRDKDELLLDMHGFTAQEIREFKKDLVDGKRVRRNGQIYMVRSGRLIVLDKKAQIKENQKALIDSIARVEAYKANNTNDSDGLIECNKHWPYFCLEDANRLRDGESLTLKGRVYFSIAYELYSYPQMEVPRIKHDVWPLFGEFKGYQLNNPFGELTPGYDGEAVVHEDIVYYVSNGELYSFGKVGGSHVKAIESYEPNKEQWRYARELVALAYTYADIEDREELNISVRAKGKADYLGDLELATLVINGEACAIADNDWWAMGLRA
nr:replication endonuclease [Pseudoalteromonas sp. S16_S37]